MSDPRITEEAVQAATRALARTFVTNKPVAGTKDFRVDARAALEAALPHLAPQPIDREAVARTLHEYDKYDEWNDEGCNDTGNDQLRYKSCRETYLERADAVLALINGGAQ